MKRLILISALGLILAALLGTGCETFGVSQELKNTIYDTQARVRRLDTTLEGSVGKLNETTAVLITRVDQSDEQTRQLKSVLEENQVRLDTLAREFSELRTTLYRHWNLTPPSGTSFAPSGGMEGAAGPVVIEKPSGADMAPPLAPPAASPASSAPPSTAVTASPPAEATAVTGDPKAAYREAMKSYESGKHDAALRQFTDYLQRYGGADAELSANAQFWLAKTYLDLGKYPEAIREFEKVRANYPASTKVPFAMHNAAVAHSRLGQKEQAIKLMQQLVMEFPDTAPATQAESDLKKLQGQ